MEAYDSITHFLESPSSQESIKFINNHFYLIAPFLRDFFPKLKAEMTSKEAVFALAKLYFADQQYDEAIECILASDLFVDDGSFFAKRMLFRMTERYEKYDVKKYLQNDPDLVKYLLEPEAVNVDLVDRLALDGNVEALQKHVDALEYPESYYVSFYIHDNYPFVSRFLTGNPLINGNFQKRCYIDFLVKNNKTDFNFLQTLVRPSGKYDTKLSTLLSNGIMNIGTTNDSLYRLNVDLLNNNKNWNKFIGTSILGMIHIGNENPYEILQNYLPNETDLKRGGALIALAFINKLEMNKDDVEFLCGFLGDSNLEGEIIYGACIALGIVAMGSGDKNLISQLHAIINRGDLLSREGALVGVGLINAGKGSNWEWNAFGSPVTSKTVSNSSQMENEFNINNYFGLICRESMHEREQRAAGLALVLNLVQKKWMDFKVLEDKHDIIRYYGVLSVGSAFVGTHDLEILQKLLKLTKDTDQDVKRAAVISIGFVCAGDASLLLNILTPLANSYCPGIRGSIALSLGFFLCGTGNLEAAKILEAFLYDKDDLVIQATGIGLGLLLMQCNSHIVPTFKRIIERMNALIVAKTEDYCFKFGIVFGRALMESGGSNVIFSIFSATNKIEPSRVVGATLFFQHFFWYPFIPFLSLCLKPTGYFEFNRDLEFCGSIQVHKRKSLFDFESIKIEEVKRKRKFKRKEKVEKEIVVTAVEEPEEYVINSGDRMTLHEMTECKREDFGFIFK